MTDDAQVGSGEQIRWLEQPFTRLDISPDDVLVLKFPGILSEEAVMRLKQTTAALFGTARVVLLEDGLEIGAVRMTEDAAGE